MDCSTVHGSFFSGKKNVCPNGCVTFRFVHGTSLGVLVRSTTNGFLQDLCAAVALVAPIFRGLSLLGYVVVFMKGESLTPCEGFFLKIVT
jgi:hypothetical protein